MKRLVICRHAKSSWNDQGLSDKDRPLNKRGKRDAPEMGKRLHAQGIKADTILTSPAQRARTTATIIAGEIGFPTSHIQVVEPLYGGSVFQVIALLRVLDGSMETVLIFGHNPVFTMLANTLGDLAIDNVPTCGIVTLDVDIREWKELGPGTGKLACFDFPKNVNQMVHRGSA